MYTGLQQILHESVAISEKWRKSGNEEISPKHLVFSYELLMSLSFLFIFLNEDTCHSLTRLAGVQEMPKS